MKLFIQMCFKSQFDFIILSEMIRIPLTFHTPQTIYQFLEKRVGPLNMLIKKGQAIVAFQKPENIMIALRDYKSTMVQGFLLNLFQYHDGDLDAKPATQSEMIAEPAAPPIVPNAPMVSDTARMIDEAIEIKDPKDDFQAVTKGHLKEVFESVAKFTPLYTTIKAREKELLAQPEGERMVKEMLRYAEGQLSEVKNNVMSLYKKTRNQINRYGKQKERCQIDLDPALRTQTVQSTPLYAGKLQASLHYANKEHNLQVKKICALNEKQFVCSNYIIQKQRKGPSRGKMKVYDLQEEYEVMSTILPQGAYGLTVIDKYLLVGNLQGSISFWNSTQGSFSNEHPFQISQKLQEGYIFDILKNGMGNNGFGIITLGIDFNIKVFEISQDLITDDIVTLFFREEASFNQGGREIMSIDLMEEQGRLVAGSWNKVITYDLPTKKLISECSQRTNIYKLKKMRENLVAVANTANVSFADPKMPAAVATCPLSQQVKSLCPVNENAVCYGTSDGEIGMIDLRKPTSPFWRDQGTHHSRIYDILRMGSRLVSGDQKGLLVGWNSAENK